MSDNYKHIADRHSGPKIFRSKERRGVHTPIYTFADSAKDAFGRLRVSSPQTLFDSKQNLDNLPLLFDDQEVSGSGTNSVHSVNRAESVLSVSTAAGLRIRQSFRRLNYQSGRSQQIMQTGNLKLSGGGAGITSGVGYIDDNNGLAMVNKENVPNWLLRSKVTGSVVDEYVPFGLPMGLSEASLSDAIIETIDPFNGSGPSGITFDASKGFLFAPDFEWLSVGTVGFNLIYDREIFPGTYLHHAGNLIGAYMSTPSLPLRWWIENDGTGVESSMSQICGTVISEAGHDPQGIPQYTSTGEDDVTADPVNANSSGTFYAIAGIRLKAAAVLSGSGDMKIHDVSILATTSDDFEWSLKHNPVVTGTFVFADKANSAMQIARGTVGSPGPTVVGGHPIEGGLTRAEGAVHRPLQSLVSLGASIAGVPDELILCARPLTNNARMHGSINWTEF